MMRPLKNDRFLKAIAREPVDATPVWIMRQAGRYLPEYRATRAKAGSFMTLCQTPELACEVTLQPLRRYDLDASIIFSDILTIPDAMGLGLSFVEGEGPRFAHPVQTERAIQQLTVPDLAKLEYVYDAIKLVQKELDGKLPLIGFTGSPWTLAAYMVEGRSKNGFPLIQAMLEKEPKLLQTLLSTLAAAVAAHLNAQIIAGVQAVMIFDTWGGMLSTENYQLFSLNYVQQVLARLDRHYNERKVPVIIFTKQGNQWLEQIAATGCDMVGVDWTITLGEARARIGQQVALQGNLNPATLLTTPEQIRAEVAAVLDSFGVGSGHVFNLGHGITPDVPPEHVTVLVDAVHEMSRSYHAK
jgi:uroporphyrinogen decarboxylase